MKKKVAVSEDTTIKKLAHILNMRGLFGEIDEFEGENLFEELLRPWLAKSNYIDFIDDVAENLHQGYTTLNVVHREELYALSRVLDILTLPFQTSCSAFLDDGWQVHRLSLSDYISFVEGLGLEIVKPKQFHPFNCEIFQAEQAEKGQENFQITKTIFPAVYLKNLLIKRAGVFISLDENYDIDYINSAKIYWAYARNNRPCEDLSHGWGHNSQWGTEHRIDLQLADGYIYNETGELNLTNVSDEHISDKMKYYLVEDGLTISEGIELLRYRQLISRNSNAVEFFPFDFKYKETNTDE